MTNYLLLNPKNTKSCLLLLTPLLIVSFIHAQILPDTLHYNHNENSAGTQWQFTAAQITDIHLGETSANGDYGTPGWNDTIDAYTTCEATEKLRNVVNWINDNRYTEKIELVFVTGDLSDRGEKSGFIMAKRILDSLTIPYIVTNGNHDMWPRVSGNQAPLPFGDSLFAEVFSDHFVSLSQQLPNWNDGTRLSRIYNPLNNIYSMFQNFAFSYGSYWFIVSDFASRYPKPVGVGTMTDAALYDITGGTYPWLASAIAQAQPSINDGMILLQHFPMDNEVLSSTYSFSSQEYDSLITIIEPFASSFGLCITGHRHRSKTYNIKKNTFSPVLGVGIETDANNKYTHGLIRLIRFWDYPSAHIQHHEKKTFELYPNPFSKQSTLFIPPSHLDETLEIDIYDLKGQLMKTFTSYNQPSVVIDKGFLNNGIYYLLIRTEKDSQIIKCAVF